MLLCHAPIVGIVISSRRKLLSRHHVASAFFHLYLLCVVDDLSVHVFRDLAGEAHSHGDDLSSVKTWEIAEDGIGTTRKLVTYPIRMKST
jgi:hypothetical protein